jgi:hypothetical protein
MEGEKFQRPKSKRPINGQKTQPVGAGLVSGIFWEFGFLAFEISERE